MLLFYTALIENESDKLLFEDIFNNHKKQMLSIAKGILHNHEDAEDAVQDALFNIARHMNSIPKHNDQLLRAYIYSTVRNTALSHLRKKTRQVKTVSMDELPLSAGMDPIECIIHMDDYECLLRIISKLPLIQREIILLRYVQEKDVKEVADILSRTPNYIRVQTFRTKELLKEILQKEGIEVADT